MALSGWHTLSIEEKQTILVISGEPVTMHLLGEALASQYDVVFATRGQSGIKLACEVLPALILLDTEIPDMNGRHVYAMLRADSRTASIPVIFIAGAASGKLEEHGMNDGADCLTTSTQPEVLQACVRDCLERNRGTSAMKAIGEFDEGNRVHISDRQKEILKWIQAGKTNGEIATIIGSSEANVKYHVRQIMDKLNVRNRTQLVAEAVRLGITSLNK